MYFDNRRAQPLSQFVRDGLFRIITEGRAWENETFPGWDGKHAVKKLGVENFSHGIIRELNGPTVLVDNEKNNGYQIRTMQQFQAEQQVIKAIAASKEKPAPSAS